jgi:NitT/TauT family transport system substrate-binding protein
MTSRSMIAALGVVLAGYCGIATAEPVTLVLNWTPGADHAPIYWAQKEGLYKAAGVDLTIETGKGSGYAAQRAGVGAAQIGIVDMPTALQARSEGADIVAAMVIFSNSPYTIYWKKSKGIKTIKDLPGHKIGAPPSDAARQMWPVIASVAGIDVNSVSWVNIAPDAKFAALQSGSIDATTQFYYFHSIAEKVFGDDMGYLRLFDIGFNPYGNAFFVNGAWAKGHAETVRNFVKVSQQAYATCMVKPEPCVATVAAAASQDVKDLADSWKLVATLVKTPDTGHAVGWLDPQRVQSDFALVKKIFGTKEADAGAAFTNAYLDPSIKFAP